MSVALSLCASNRRKSLLESEERGLVEHEAQGGQHEGGHKGDGGGQHVGEGAGFSDDAEGQEDEEQVRNVVEDVEAVASMLSASL